MWGKEALQLEQMAVTKVEFSAWAEDQMERSKSSCSDQDPWTLTMMPMLMEEEVTRFLATSNFTFFSHTGSASHS